MAGMPRKEVNTLLKHVEAQGARLEEKKNGTMIYFPDGSTAMAHFTTSDTNAFRPLRAAVKRAGLTWPGDHTDHGKKPGSLPATLKAIRKAFFDNGYRPMALQEIVVATGLSQPTISRAAASGELVKVKRGVWKLPEILPGAQVPIKVPEPELELVHVDVRRKPEPVLEKLLKQPVSMPDPEYPNIEHAKKLLELKDGGIKLTLSTDDDLSQPGDYRAKIEQVDFIDERDSWVVENLAFLEDMTIGQIRVAYKAAGLEMEVRVWHSKPSK